ncbi:hypothetical protein HK100_009570 [Physocladia obscura]|uniref:Fungal lipase-type domain-containing protein n=1 Tax=Physocladia obscura TaxID=109957 RepID=A0AAD5T353_9FUNG|nr:hypothetical protein HK100_009570 [Physocladia obscura]
MQLHALVYFSFAILAAAASSQFPDLPLVDTYGPNDPRATATEPAGYRQKHAAARQEFNSRMKGYDSFDALTKQRWTSYYNLEVSLPTLLGNWSVAEGWGSKNKAGTVSKRSYTGSGPDSASFLSQMKTYLYFAQSAYCASANINAWDCSSCVIANTEDIYAYPSTDGNEQGYIAVNTNLNAIIVSFRGSSNIENWINNLEFLPTSVPIPGVSSSVEVHNGFWTVWSTLQATTFAQLRTYRAAHPTYGVVFTGHSLGAAVAILAAVDAVVSGIVPAASTSVIDFGEPRVGNSAFYSYVLSLGFQQLSRVVNYNDIVPHFPLESWGFNHHTQEQWVDSASNLVYCNDVSNGGEDTNCANTVVPFVSITAHLDYFGIPLGGTC